MALIASVSAPSIVRPAESFKLTVNLAAGATETTSVLINGAYAQDMWLQAPARLGEWPIFIVAKDGQTVETRTHTVKLAGAPAAPLLSLIRKPFTPLTAVFALTDIDPSVPMIRAGDIYRWSVQGNARATQIPLLEQHLDGFVNDDMEWTPLEVSVAIEHADQTSHAIRRTLLLGSVYRVMRDRLNQVRPPIDTDGLSKQVSVGSSNYKCRMTVRNLEPQGIRFTLKRYEWMLEDDAMPAYGPDIGIDVHIAARGSRYVEETVDRRTAAVGSVGVTIHLFGTLDDGFKIHTSASFTWMHAKPFIPPTVPVEIAHPTILDKVSSIVSKHGGDPYELSAHVDGLLKPPADGYRRTVTQSDLWSLDLARSIGERLATFRNGNALFYGSPLEAVAQSVKAVAMPSMRAMQASGPPLMRTMGQSEPRDSASGTRGGRHEQQTSRQHVKEHVSHVDRARDVTGLLGHGAEQVPDAAGVWARGGIADKAQADTVRLSDLFGHVASGVDDKFCSLLSSTAAAEVKEGGFCDPDNPPDDVAKDFACQFEGTFKECRVPARLVRAKKGDIVLAPGGNGIIGGLLLNADPTYPQLYAHSGIMTRNLDQISHATSSEERLRDHPVGVAPVGSKSKQPTDGFEMDALRYQWPGGVTQSVEAAYGGSMFISPEGKPYRIAAFSRADYVDVGGVWALIQPMIVKPKPEDEFANPQIRQRLHRVADEVRALCVTEHDTETGKQSKVHYRFYCYTDAAISERPSPSGVVGEAPDTAGWAAGTLPAVCSQVIWACARRAGEKLEGQSQFTAQSDLEPDDVAKGARTDDLTLDGLYLYPEEVRKHAGTWLFNYLVDKIYKEEVTQGGWAGGALNEFFSDIADDCANQIINTFAFDWANTGAKDSDRWENPGVGRAVSPDNIMFWDRPQASGFGLWGYAEPADYQQARVDAVPVTTWHKVDGDGTLRGKVTFRSSPVPYASLNAGGITATAGAQGDFSIVLRQGRYALKGEAYISAEVSTASALLDVTIEHDEEVFVEVPLQPPPDKYRSVIVDVSIEYRDDEFTLNPFESDPDEHASGKTYWEFQVQPWATYAEQSFENSWGGECRVKVRASATLNYDLSVELHVWGDLFEDVSDDAKELKGGGDKWFHIPKDAVKFPCEVTMQHDDEEDTYARFTMEVTNRTQPS